MEKKIIYVAVLGAPNCGKSTLANSIIDEKVCLTSCKPHTTREPTLAIFTKENTQIVFIDTPGIGKGRKKTEMQLGGLAKKSLNGADLCLFMFDASKRVPQNLLDFADQLQQEKIAFINKIDRVSKGRLLPITDSLKDSFPHIFYGSALNSEGIEKILDFILEKAKEGEWNYKASEKTTRLIDQRINDRTQEAVFEIMSNEIPYQITIKLLDVLEKNDTSMVIKQQILIKKAHKHMFLGHIKKISMSSREKMEKMFKKKIHLFIDIKCKK